MKLKLDTSTTRFFTSSKPEVTPVFGFENGARMTVQSTDKETGLLLWQTTGEFIQGDNVEQGKKIKIASATVPVLTARTEYQAEGELFATPYVPNGGKNAEISILLVGSLKSTRTNSPLAKD